MRVLMISKALVTGAYHTKPRELALLGIELYIVIPERWGSIEAEIKRAANYSIYTLNSTFNGHNHLHFYHRLEGAFKKLRPQIAHIDEEHYSLVTFQSMRLAKKYDSKALFFTWQNIYKRYPFPFSWIEKYNFRNADMAIAGSQEAQEVLRKKGFSKEIAVIPQFGVDTDIFMKRDSSGLRRELGLEPDRFVMGFMGRLVEEKGILGLVDAAARLKEDFYLLFVGNGPLRSKILDKASRVGIADRIRMIEQVPSMEVPGYLNCFDCLVLPSLTRSNWKEQFGRVLVEAMACEIPVIGSNSGEIPEVIADAGLIFEEGNAGDLTKKIEMVRNDDKLKATLCNRGRERVLNNYTQKKVAESAYKLYKKLLSV